MMAWVMEQEESKKMREIKFRVWDSAGKQMCPVIVADLQDIKATKLSATSTRIRSW